METQSQNLTKDTQRLKMLIFGALIVTGIIGLVFWRTSITKIHPVHDGILVDPSDSQSNRCSKVSTIAREAMNTSNRGRGSTISLFRMGDASTANEAVLIETFALPDDTKVMGGPNAIAEQRQQLIDRIAKRCSEMPQTTVTPMYLSLKRNVEFLQSLDRGAGARLTLHVVTDGEETVSQEIKKALSDPPGAKLNLPATINNDYVKIVICGFAETIGLVSEAKGKTQTKTKERTALRADRQREVWKNIFSHPELVDVQPYCLEVNEQKSTPKPN